MAKQSRSGPKMQMKTTGKVSREGMQKPIRVKDASFLFQQLQPKPQPWVFNNMEHVGSRTLMLGRDCKDLPTPLVP